MDEEQHYDIELNGDETLVLKYDWLPYTYNRIEAILRDYYNCELIDNTGYKEGRYNPYFRKRYRIVELTTREVINVNVYLDDLRHFFANHNIPLHKEDIPVHKRERNQGAETFINSLMQVANKEGNIKNE